LLAQDLRRLLTRGTSSGRAVWITTFLICTSNYALTAHWFGINNVDSLAAAYPGWHFVHHGSFFLDSGSIPDNQWFVSSGTHVVSNRMAGVILVGVPMQFLLKPLGAGYVEPAVVTAILVTATAMATLALVLYRVGGHGRMAMSCALALAFGTGFWPNASAELWPHGPDAMWLSLALLAIQSDRQWWAGLALAPAIMTRPHLALVAATIGCSHAWGKRQLLPMLRIAVPCVAGVGVLLAWNRAMFEKPSVGGAYSNALPSVASTSVSGLESTLTSAAGSLFSPLCGLLVLSPFVALGMVAALQACRDAPSWEVGAALGGCLYMVAQWRINGFTGGAGFFSYRLTLELLVLGAPLAYRGYLDLRLRRPIASVARSLVGVSVAAHVIGVYWWKPSLGPEQILDPWRTWAPGETAASHGEVGLALAALIASGVIALYAWDPTRLLALKRQTLAAPEAGTGV
jgi:hypothetical protein